MNTNNFDSIRSFCNRAEPYDHSQESNAAFIEAMTENLIWHQSQSPFYKKFLENSNFQPKEHLRRIEDCHRIPYIPAELLKHHEIVSVARENIYAHLTSSGTSGQKSQMFFDRWSLTSAQSMVDKIFDFYGWIQKEEKVNYLLFTYEPAPSSEKLGTAYTDHYLCQYAPADSVFYALRRNGRGGHEFDVYGTIRALQDFQKSGLPLRIFGFPSFLWFTLQRIKDLEIKPLSFSGQSLVFLGGGWKGYAGQQIPKHELYTQTRELLGIPDHRLRDGYGSVEHCIPYIECDHHEFHIPTWSRVLIRDVKTLAVAGYDKPGLLQFLSPYITSVPAASVLMGDLASLHPASSCGCKLKTDFFRIHGRAGLTQNRSCAMAAAELLNSKGLRTL